MKPKTIEELAASLDISAKRLNGMRRQFRMEHGDQGEVKLLRWLERTYAEMRDEPRLLRPTLPRIKFGPEPKPLDAETIQQAAEESAYTANSYQALKDEPEAVPLAYQNALSVDARTRRALEAERSQQDTQAQIRSITQALREKASRGEDIGHHLARIAREIRTEDAA